MELNFVKTGSVYTEFSARLLQCWNVVRYGCQLIPVRLQWHIWTRTKSVVTPELKRNTTISPVTATASDSSSSSTTMELPSLTKRQILAIRYYRMVRYHPSQPHLRQWRCKLFLCRICNSWLILWGRISLDLSLFLIDTSMAIHIWCMWR